MDLSCGHFYKTIKEAETAIKEYSKEHYFVINRGSSKTVGDDFRRIKLLLYVRDDFRRINKILLVGNWFSWNLTQI